MKIFLALVLLFVINLFAQVELTNEEKTFLKTNPIIKIGTLKDFPPYDMVDENNKYDGFNADIIKAINKHTGANLMVFPYDTWAQVYEEATSANIHGIIGLSWSKQREEKYFYYSDPYHYSPYSVIVHKSNNSIKHFKDIAHKKILVRTNSITETIIKSHFKNPIIIYCDSVEQIYEKINNKEGDVFLDVNLDAQILKKYDLKIVTELYDKAGELYIGVHHKFPLLHSIIKKGLASISLEEMISMRNKWFNTTLTLSDLKLNFVEKNYIKQKRSIKVCSVNYPPYVFLKGDKIAGLSVDIFDYYQKILGIPFEIVVKESHKECEMLLKNNEVDVNDSHGYDKNALHTQNYIDDFFVLVTNYEKPYIDDFSELQNMTITIDRHFLPTLSDFRKKYPNINFIIVSNPEQALKDVLLKKTFGHIDLHKTAAWLIKENYLGQLKVSGVLDEYKINKLFETTYIDDSQILQSILNKIISLTPPSKIREISNSWVSIVFTTGFDYVFVMQMIVLFGLILFVILYFNYQLNKKVKEHLQKYEHHQKILFQQSKLASMGEMLNNIAHQWRQPLNRINSSVAVIDLLAKDENIKQKIRDIEKNTKYMSDTIDDFANFFQPNKQKEKFNVVDAIYKATNLLQERLKSVSLQIKYEKDPSVNGYEKEFIHMIITILNNALDNFEIQKIVSPTIVINIKTKDQMTQIYIEDNGGGVPEDIIDKIFDPYFTTKGLTNGLGVGLYMSKMICENSMDGKLSVSNNEKGAVFLIELRK